MAKTFASGKYAKSLCQRCGWEYPYSEVKRERGTRLLVCPECDDKNCNRVDHPQNKKPRGLGDAEGLQNPSIDPRNEEVDSP